ncbi:MAG: capsular polysaccharide biosynthesis protein [Paracoccaceae bacterium]
MTVPGDTPGDTKKAGSTRSRLFVYNGGFLTQGRVRRILSLAGFDIKLGQPGPDDLIGVWGQSPTSHRGEGMAARRDTPVVRIEDAFLRSLHPGRAGEPPIGLLIDRTGLHFDPAQPSDLEQILAHDPLDDTALLNRARAGIERMRENHITKYAGFDPTRPAPEPGYVLVVDQTEGDASVTASKADAARFQEMLVFAQEEHPGARVLIKTHPETLRGYRQGYFSEKHQSDRVTLFADPISPWALLEGAIGVYTVSSQMGFEAILAGHKPRVFGQPFYSGWGLTADEDPLPRRQRILTRAQLFAAAMILYPTWYDPHSDALGSFEDALGAIEAQARAWRQDHRGWTAGGMRLWKRRPLQRFFGRYGKLSFTDQPGTDRPHMVWAGKASQGDRQSIRVEDGFLRSRGLGAELVPALSLVTDHSGIYYDPRHPSDLETWITKRARLSPQQSARAETLRHALISGGVSKYNLGGTQPDLPPGHRILVPGQVEDDASILTGAGSLRTNTALLQAARDANPDAVLIYKPHPDVEAGLRTGQIATDGLADVTMHDVDPAWLLTQVNELWTLTSLMGFEALLRGVKVTTLGAPFYAGWGLTKDLGEIPDRRHIEVPLTGLIHAALIDYPRYLDPVTGFHCSVEIAIKRLRAGDIPHPGAANRLLAKLQGIFASYTHLWR